MKNMNPHNSTSTMTRTDSSKKKTSWTCKLNPLTFRKILKELVQDIYGEDNRYLFEDPALIRLQQSAEQYIECNMWNKIKEITIRAGRRQVLPRDIREWKRTTDIKVRVKRINISLCSIFDSLPKKSKVPV